MVICEQRERQLVPSDTCQTDDRAVKTAERSEAYQHAAIGMAHVCGAIGRNIHQALGTGPYAIKLYWIVPPRGESSHSAAVKVFLVWIMVHFYKVGSPFPELQ
jgi:hypothetical protein